MEKAIISEWDKKFMARFGYSLSQEIRDLELMSEIDLKDLWKEELDNEKLNRKAV